MREWTSLKENKDFKRLYYKGKYKVHPLLVTYLIKGRYPECRVGITAGKKIGNAVCRSRVRRIIRAAFDQMEKKFDLRGYDLVFATTATMSPTSAHRVW